MTGSTQGLGADIAKTVAGAGASGVVIQGRDPSTKAQPVVDAVREASGGACEALVVAADLARSQDCHDLIAQADAHFGRIDGLVNAAGCTFRGGLFNSDDELWDYMFNVNAKAPFILTSEAAKCMKRDNIQGSIVNISSKSATGGQPFLTTYCASKAALDCVTKNAAQTLKGDGIRVNSVMMGWSYTDNEHLTQLDENPAGERWLEEADARSPVGRILRPNDISAMTLFLLSDASTMVTGGLHNIYPEEDVPGCYD